MIAAMRMVNKLMRLLDIFTDLLFEDLEGQKASRGQFIKDKFGKDWRGIPGYAKNQFDALIDKIGEVDPSRMAYTCHGLHAW